MSSNGVTLGVVGIGYGAFTMRLTAIEWLVVLLALAFAGYQLVLVFERGRPEALWWLVAGATVYWLLGDRFLFGLDEPWECGVFSGLVAVNLALIFARWRPENARLFFLDMTLCFCLSHLVIPGRATWFGFTSRGRTPYGLLLRPASAIAANAAILVVLIGGYVLATKLQLLTTEPAPPRDASVA